MSLLNRHEHDWDERGRLARRGLSRIMLSTAVAATVSAVLVAPSESAVAGGDPTLAGGGRVQSFWLHLNSTPVPGHALFTEARRRSHIVLNAWEDRLVPRLKAMNPAVQVFVYKDLSSTRSYACRNGIDDAQLPTGVGYCEAEKNHPEWFLLDPGGRRFEYNGYSGHWQMDVGNTAYQDAWATRVIEDSTASRFDGVFMDNALFPCDAYHPGVCPEKYPTDAAFQQAYKSMLANTRDKFVAAGLKTVANLSNARLHAGAWDAYTEHLDGGFDEWWLAFDDDNLLPEYAEGWSRQVAEIASNEARGKITWVQPHFTAGNDRAFRYALAGYLLVNGGHAAIAEIEETDGYDDASPWHPEYTWDLGTPAGPYRSVARNVFRRDFSCGTALVNANPTGSRSVTVKLGSSYVDERGMIVTSVSLSGTSGSILRRFC
jgi:hypothetical protein